MKWDEARARHLSTESHFPTCDYFVDAEDRITHVTPGWQAFARENAAGERLSADRVIDRPLFDFIGDSETRLLYGIILRRVREGGSPITVPFRCDGPEVRRFMELRIRHAGHGALHFSGRLLREERRPAVAILDAEAERSREIVQMCGWCKQVKIGDAWVEVEQAVADLNLFDDLPLPRLSHGMCPACDLRLRAELQLEHGGGSWGA